MDPIRRLVGPSARYRHWQTTWKATNIIVEARQAQGFCVLTHLFRVKGYVTNTATEVTEPAKKGQGRESLVNSKRVSRTIKLPTSTITKIKQYVCN